VPITDCYSITALWIKDQTVQCKLLNALPQFTATYGIWDVNKSSRAPTDMQHITYIVRYICVYPSCCIVMRNDAQFSMGLGCCCLRSTTLPLAVVGSAGGVSDGTWFRPAINTFQLKINWSDFRLCILHANWCYYFPSVHKIDFRLIINWTRTNWLPVRSDGASDGDLSTGFMFPPQG
jgi:hypothetical protein